MFEQQGVCYSIIGLTEEEFFDIKHLLNKERMFCSDPEKCKNEEYADKFIKLYLEFEKAWINTTVLL